MPSAERRVPSAELTILLALLVGGAGGVNAQSAPVPIKEEKPGLLAQATVTPDSARAVALRAVAKGGKIAAAEIEEEGGKLVYSFDIKIPKKKGIDEVLVDAKTGKVVAVEHESAATEAAETKKEPPKKPPVLR